MNIVKIPKKAKGEFREICVPSKEEKIKFQNILPELEDKMRKLCDQDVVQGFSRGKSPVTNATEHIGKRYTLRFDLSNFFDTIKPSHLKGKIKQEIVDKVMPNGRAYQGLPTSPLVANIAANSMDDAIVRLISKLSYPVVYTRYADDLTFSFDDHGLVSFLKENVNIIVARCGFSINKAKTWLQDSKFGNRIITGLAVGDKVVAPRRIRKKLRAALHQKNIKSTMGLMEYCKVKLPQEKNFISNHHWKALLVGWGLRQFDIKQLPRKDPDIDLGDSMVITGDPVLLLGLSNFTTNWQSCMRHPDGSKHLGAVFWPLLKGVYIAALFAEETMTWFGFTRKKMRARVLVYTMRNGNRYYGRVYGECSACREALKLKLKHNNIKYISSCPSGEKVSGNVPLKFSRPYFDILSAVKCESAGRKVWILKT